MARRFKPNHKFKVGQFIILDKEIDVYADIAEIIRAMPKPVQERPSKVILKILHINIYNRNNMKYICKDTNGNIQEIDTIYAERYGITGKPSTLKVLYGNSKIR